jgi:hypothetical protein
MSYFDLDFAVPELLVPKAMSLHCVVTLDFCVRLLALMIYEALQRLVVEILTQSSNQDYNLLPNYRASNCSR